MSEPQEHGTPHGDSMDERGTRMSRHVREVVRRREVSSDV
ncbi:hypothetical protein HNR21_003575 [Actinomadura cellulosilytica]|uniref:Uncharacterized protein n=1 Tax=Thermomonospora cellulosilytica TaxID=1411118 RepID=A0A7W3R8V4_9ACTN|nr:hypothetical protein [Thermomonospora cellulosilytica]